MIVCVCVWKRERVTAGMMRPRGLTKPLIRTYRANHMSTHNFRNTHTLENKTRANSPNVHIKLEVYVVPPSTTLPHYPPSHIKTLNQSAGLPPSIKCQGLCECDSMMINSLTARVIHHSSRAVSWAVGMMRHETIGTPPLILPSFPYTHSLSFSFSQSRGSIWLQGAQSACLQSFVLVNETGRIWTEWMREMKCTDCIITLACTEAPQEAGCSLPGL